MSASRKYERYFKPISREPFSTAGTIRSQGWVGQTSLNKHYSRTPFVGTSPVGYGSMRGMEPSEIVFSCCSSSRSEGKSSKTTKGFLLSTMEHPTSVYNTFCTDTCIKNIVKDFSSDNKSQSAFSQRKHNKNVQQNWRDLDGTVGKCYTCVDDNGGTPYHIGGRLVPQILYAKEVSALSSSEYMRTQYLYKNKTEDCCG